MDLVDFLRARLDEDEALARSLIGEYSWGYSTFWEASTEELAHIDRWRPYRVLAEVAAKRRILADYEDSGLESPDYIGALSGVLAALASVYANHPDYQPEWARAE